MIIEDALYIYIYKVNLCDRSRLRCRRGNRKSRGFYSAIGAACGAGVAIADLTLLCRWYYYFWELIVSDNLFIQPLMTANTGSLHKFGVPEC